MSTFLEFYLALIRFVNHKLFIDLGIKHPLESFPENINNKLYLNVLEV